VQDSGRLVVRTLPQQKHALSTHSLSFLSALVSSRYRLLSYSCLLSSVSYLLIVQRYAGPYMTPRWTVDLAVDSICEVCFWAVEGMRRY
jgi:hypothetical protein